MQIFLVATILLFGASPALAQSACGRALMMAGPDLNGPAESAQKRRLERECALEAERDRVRETQARERAEKSPQGQGVARLRARNPLELAVDPRGAARRHWDAFRDEGGLGAHATFYGVEVRKAVVDLDGESVVAATLDVAASASPRQLRAALTQACGGDEADWRVAHLPNGARGELDAPELRCAYAIEDGASEIVVTIARR